jgi:hypothetical protein
LNVYYVEVLPHLQDKMRSKRQEIRIQQHSDVPSRMAMSVQQFLIEEQVIFVPQPLYSSDHATCAFWFLRLKKMRFQGRCFGTLEMSDATLQPARAPYQRGFL